jgi:hypothetical protein
MKKILISALIIIILFTGIYIAKTFVFKKTYSKAILSYKAQNFKDAEKYFRLSLLCKRKDVDAITYMAKLKLYKVKQMMQN